LAPPQGCGRIRLDRFSPNYDHAAERGFTNVRPQAYYNFIFGVDREDLGDIAYFFDYDYEDQRDPEAYTRGVRDLIAKWRAQPDSQLIYRRLSEGRAVLEDTRFTAVEPLILLTEAERVVYEICDTAHTIPNLTRRLADSGLGSDEGEVVEMLQRFCSLRIMVGDSGRYVGVAPLGDLPANEREKDRVLAIMTKCLPNPSESGETCASKSVLTSHFM
jgi:hypothetical protein